MKGEMDTVGEMFASMGSFTAAFGMDRLNFGTLIGFYSIECGNILGLGDTLFASLIGVSVLSKEEGQNGGVPADTPHIKNARCYREAGGSSDANYLYESYHIWSLLVVDGIDWRGYSLERGSADAWSILSAPIGAGRNLFRYISVPASWQHRDRYGACCHNVLFKPDCQYDRTREISKIHNPICTVKVETS